MRNNWLNRRQRAAEVDARAAAEADTAAEKATAAAARNRTNMALLVAAWDEHIEGRDALAAELTARQAVAGRVSMADYLV